MIQVQAMEYWIAIQEMGSCFSALQRGLDFPLLDAHILMVFNHFDVQCLSLLAAPAKCLGRSQPFIAITPQMKQDLLRLTAAFSPYADSKKRTFQEKCQ